MRTKSPAYYTTYDRCFECDEKRQDLSLIVLSGPYKGKCIMLCESCKSPGPSGGEQLRWAA
jgi:hypothetical protein